MENKIFHSEKDTEINLSVVVQKLVSSFKNYILYPEGHILADDSTENVVSVIKAYTEELGGFSFEVTKNGLMDDGRYLYEISGSDDSFVTPLFRDGVYKISFAYGLTAEELFTFFSIVKKYRVLPDEPESDIVTDCWKENFQFIHYEAAEPFWDDEPDFFFPSPIENAQSIDYTDNYTESDDFMGNYINGFYIEPEHIDPLVLNHARTSNFVLTGEESSLIKKMIDEESKYDHANDVLEILFFLLCEEKSVSDINQLLNELKNEFIIFIQKGELENACNIITRIKNAREQNLISKIQTKDCIDLFFKNISEVFFTEIINEIIPLINEEGKKDLNFIKSIISNLDLNYAQPLIKVISQIKNRSIRTDLCRIAKIEKEYSTFEIKEIFAAGSEADISYTFELYLAGKNQNDNELIKLLLSNRFPSIRFKALDYFLNFPSPEWEELFALINDPDIEVRKLLIEKLSLKRSVIIEQLLIDYILSKNIENFGDDHILNCFKALGRCGSAVSIPVLKRKLFEKPLLGYIGKGHKSIRLGAAVALNELKLFEAKELLEKASKSRYSTIVNAYKFAIKDDIFQGNQ